MSSSRFPLYIVVEGTCGGIRKHLQGTVTPLRPEKNKKPLTRPDQKSPKKIKKAIYSDDVNVI